MVQIILHNYNLYYGELIYIGIFLVYLRMALIFTNFLAEHGHSERASACDQWFNPSSSKVDSVAVSY